MYTGLDFAIALCPKALMHGLALLQNVLHKVRTFWWILHPILIEAFVIPYHYFRHATSPQSMALSET